MRDFEIYERRAREAEELADLVNMPQNRVRYLAIARAWRDLLDDARRTNAATESRAA